MTNKPLVFTSSDWFTIKGRGRVATVNERLPVFGLWHPDQLKDKQVTIDGKPYTVKGVERFLIGGISPENPYNLSLGLLVEPEERS